MLLELTGGKEPGYQHFLNMELHKASGVNHVQIMHSTGDQPSAYQATHFIAASGHVTPSKTAIAISLLKVYNITY